MTTDWTAEWTAWIRPLAPAPTAAGPLYIEQDGAYEGPVPQVQTVDNRERDWPTVGLGCCLLGGLALGVVVILALVFAGPVLGF